jgi:multidrug resistance efflux pump
VVGDAQLRAPYEGTIAARYLDPGAMAGPSRPVARLLGSSDARVRFAVPEEQSGTVAPGMHARLTAKALDAPLATVVESVAPEVDSAAHMIFAVARINTPSELAQRLSTGMVVHVAMEAVQERP